jgi:hypothetical protein
MPKMMITIFKNNFLFLYIGNEEVRQHANQEAQSYPILRLGGPKFSKLGIHNVFYVGFQ